MEVHRLELAVTYRLQCRLDRLDNGKRLLLVVTFPSHDSEGGRMLYINPEECIDCGACMPVCPTDAIYWEDDLPKDQQHFKRINHEFFIPIGNLQGARNHTQKDLDHPEIKEL